MEKSQAVQILTTLIDSLKFTKKDYDLVMMAVNVLVAPPVESVTQKVKEAKEALKELTN